MHMQIGKERFRNFSYIKKVISYELIDLSKWPLTKRLGACETEVSSILRRHQLESFIPFALEFISHTSLQVTNMA